MCQQGRRRIRGAHAQKGSTGPITGGQIEMSSFTVTPSVCSDDDALEKDGRSRWECTNVLEMKH